MERTADTIARRQRLTAAATVAALAGATALAFGRVFQGREPTVELAAVAVVSVVLAAALERRGLLLATIASAAALLWTIAIVIFPKTLWYGLPSLETLDAIRQALGLVGEQAKVQVAPTPPLDPLLLAAVTAVWTASFSAHALAVRAGSPVLAVLPPVALVAFADTVLEDGARPVYAVTFLAAALAVVFLDGLRRIRQWGPVWTERHRSRTQVEGARSVAVIAVATAVLLPGVLPGFRSGPLVDFSTSGQGGTHLDPFASILAKINAPNPVPLFKIQTNADPAYFPYWRTQALDTFDGTSFGSSDPSYGAATTIESPATLPMSTPAGASTLDQEVQILANGYDDPIPMSYPGHQVDVPSGSIRYESDLGAALLPDGVDSGYRYRVTSSVDMPTPQQLNAVRFPPASSSDRDTYLANVDPALRALVLRWTAGETTPYQKIFAIQTHLLDPTVFQYSTDPPDLPSGTDPILAFLTRTKTGFCQQFATAMATLVRELGYPARLAIGYRPGVRTGNTFTVSSSDAHVWVEVDFPDYGWLPFDPTPRGGHPTAPADSYLNPVSPQKSGDGKQTTEVDPKQTTSCAVGVPRQLCNADAILGGHARIGTGGGPGTFVPDRSAYDVPYRWGALGLLVVLLVLGLAIPPWKALRRRRLLHRARDARERVLAAYRVFDGEAADLGLGRRDAETVEEYRARLAAAMALSDGHLTVLTEAAARAAYSAAQPTPGEARAAAEAARATIRDLRRGAGLPRRLLGTYRPGW
jgi:transglutaminase-like putative cysteine protease